MLSLFPACVRERRKKASPPVILVQTGVISGRGGIPGRRKVRRKSLGVPWVTAVIHKFFLPSNC